jgi:hypothetical protein
MGVEEEDAEKGEEEREREYSPFLLYSSLHALSRNHRHSTSVALNLAF